MKPLEEQLKDAESWLRISIVELPELELKNIPFTAYKGIAQLMVNYANRTNTLAKQLGRQEVIEEIKNYLVPCGVGIQSIGDHHYYKDLLTKLNQLKD